MTTVFVQRGRPAGGRAGTMPGADSEAACHPSQPQSPCRTQAHARTVGMVAHSFPVAGDDSKWNLLCVVHHHQCHTGVVPGATVAATPAGSA